MVWPGGWGQGQRGAAGYHNHGESEINIRKVKPELCSDIMTTDPAFCQQSDTVVVAAKLMKAHNIGALPVVGNLHQRTLVGIVTDRDLALRVIAEERDPAATAVEQIMSFPLVTCSPDDPYPKALELMEKHQVKRIPAVDSAGHAVGMISEADVVLRIGQARRTVEWAASICRPS